MGCFINEAVTNVASKLRSSLVDELPSTLRNHKDQTLTGTFPGVSLLLCGLFSNPRPYPTSPRVYEDSWISTQWSLMSLWDLVALWEFQMCSYVPLKGLNLGAYSNFFSPSVSHLCGDNPVLQWSTYIAWSQCWSVEGAAAQSTCFSTICFVTVLFWVTGYQRVYKFN